MMARPSLGRSIVTMMSASRRDSEKVRGKGTSWIVSCGCLLASLARTGARWNVPKPSGAPTRTVPLTVLEVAGREASARSSSDSMRSARTRSPSPAGVMTVPVVRRSKSFTPMSSSRASSLLATVAWLTCKALAAARIWPARAIARKMRMLSQSITTLRTAWGRGCLAP